MKYFDELKSAMSLLDSHPKTVFIGQAVEYEGTGLYDSLKHLPNEKTIELPVETLARPSQAMPQWAVRLHNDNKNDMVYVVSTLVQLVRLPAKDATERTLETHNHGSAIVFQTHREHAELVRDQLQSKGLSATIEKN